MFPGGVYASGEGMDGGRSRRVKVKTLSWTWVRGHLVSPEGRHLYSFSSSPWVETSKTGRILEHEEAVWLASAKQLGEEICVMVGKTP